MKTMSKFFGLVVLAVTMFSLNTQAATVVGETNSEMGKYWLKESSNAIVVEGEELPTYVIHYDSLSQPVYVGILESRKCKTYIVRTSDLELVYTCKNGKFGIEYMPKKLATMPTDKVKAKISRTDFLRQRVITTNNLSEKKHLGLIAAYLPQVML